MCFGCVMTILFTHPKISKLNPICEGWKEINSRPSGGVRMLSSAYGLLRSSLQIKTMRRTIRICSGDDFSTVKLAAEKKKERREKKKIY